MTAEQYTETLNLAKLFTDTMEIMTDNAFIDFLSSQKTEKGAGAPGSASESFEAL